jgi:hypothetical protein
VRLVEIDYDTYVELGKAGVWVNWNPSSPLSGGLLTPEELLSCDSYPITKKRKSTKYYTRVEDDG